MHDTIHAAYMWHVYFLYMFTYKIRTRFVHVYELHMWYILLTYHNVDVYFAYLQTYITHVNKYSGFISKKYMPNIIDEYMKFI